MSIDPLRRPLRRRQTQARLRKRAPSVGDRRKPVLLMCFSPYGYKSDVDSDTSLIVRVQIRRG